jgi:hypothetical protein
MVDTGVEAIKIEINGAPKAGFTLIRSRAANGDMFPLFLVAKGRTSRCHEQFGPGFPGVISRSKSGWVSQEAFCEYLIFLCQNRGQKTIVLATGEYPTHQALPCLAKA